MSSALIERCRGRWREILMEIGIPASALTGKHAPCPACGGKDRFRFDDKDGSGSWFCNQCPRRSGYGIHLPKQVLGWSYAETCQAIEAVLVGAGEDVTSRTQNARHATAVGGGGQNRDDLESARLIWNGRQPVSPDNAAGRHLAARGIDAIAIRLSLGFHPHVLYLHGDGEFVGRFPAMLAVVQRPNGKPTGIHRTFLTSAGLKADVPQPRKLLGAVPEGAAVRLADHGNVLGIAEGIETALSASILFDIPCWSAINTSGLASWKPPADVSHVVIFGDNDAKFAGQSASYSAAHRLACKGLNVRVEIPNDVGDDWNDVLLKRRAA